MTLKSKQTKQKKVSLHLLNIDFFPPELRMALRSQTCSLYTVSQPQKDDYLSMKYHCLSSGVLCVVLPEVEQVSQSDL